MRISAKTRNTFLSAVHIMATGVPNSKGFWNLHIERHRLTLTMISIWSVDLYYACSCRLVFSDLGFKLISFKPWSIIIYVNHLDRQHLSGGMLRYPMILCDNSEIVALLLLAIQRFEDGERTWRREEDKNICISAAVIICPVAEVREFSVFLLCIFVIFHLYMANSV